LLIYWSLFAILAIGALLSEEGKQSRLLFFALASVPSIAMIGSRWEIGPDWPAYLEIFTYTKLYSFRQSISHADPGFFGAMWVLHQFRAPFWVLNMICGIVFVSGLTAFARRQPNPWLAYLIAFPYLVLVVAMSAARQSVALGLMFFALNDFARGRLLRCFALLLVAALFHGSVLLIVPLCLLSYARNGVQRILLLMAAAAIGYYVLRGAFDIYAVRYSSIRIQSGGVGYRLAMNAFPALLCLVFGRRLGLDEHSLRLWRNVSLCSLALVPLLVFLPSSTAIDRFLLYLFPLQFVILSRTPEIIASNREGSKPIRLALIAYVGLVQFVFLSLGTFARYYVPYQSILWT
jgi:hypothetical protein